jgi:hypothetical protein
VSVPRVIVEGMVRFVLVAVALVLVAARAEAAGTPAPEAETSAVVEAARKHLNAGDERFAAGDPDAARREYDAAIDTFLESGYDLGPETGGDLALYYSIFRRKIDRRATSNVAGLASSGAVFGTQEWEPDKAAPDAIAGDADLGIPAGATSGEIALPRSVGGIVRFAYRPSPRGGVLAVAGQVYVRRFERAAAHRAAILEAVGKAEALTGVRLDPALVAAVAALESDNTPGVWPQDTGTAQGLVHGSMQTTDVTLVSLNRRYGTGFNAWNVRTPHNGYLAGALTLAGNVRRRGGSVPLALADYLGWGEAGDKNGTTYRTYVPAVMAMWHVYRATGIFAPMPEAPVATNGSGLPHSTPREGT